MFHRKSALRAPATTGGASEPARPRTLLPLTPAVWRWFKAPVAMLVAMSAADAVKYLPDDESAPEGAASGTCSGGGKGMPPSGPFSSEGTDMPICEAAQSSLAASVSTPDPTGSPIGHVYRVEIPEGWRVLRAVFFLEPDVLHGSTLRDKPDWSDPGVRRLQAGVLLCRQGEDDRAAVQEFEGGACLEAAFLSPSGRYLRESQDRPAFAVIPLAYSSQNWTDRSAHGECLVVLPLVRFPHRSGEAYPAPIAFVDGEEAGRTGSGFFDLPQARRFATQKSANWPRGGSAKRSRRSLSKSLFWAGEIIGAASLFILLFLLLFIGSAIQ